MQYCTRCGAPLSAGVAACSACGHPVGVAASPGAAQPPGTAGQSAMPASTGPATADAPGAAPPLSATTPIGTRSGTPLSAPPAQTGWQKAEKVLDAVDTGFRLVARILVSLLWIGITIVGFASGVWVIGVLGILYLVYLWFFRGRWLIY